MKLGLFYGGAPDVEGHVKGAVDAENDGFDSIWYGQIFGPDVLTVIAMAGERTSRVEFGTSVVPTYTRHPTVMAAQALTTQAARTSQLQTPPSFSLRKSIALLTDNRGRIMFSPATCTATCRSLLRASSRSRASNARSRSSPAKAIATKILPLVHFRSLGCSEGEQWPIRPGCRESSRTISVRCGAVNRKMDKLPRAQIVA